MDKELVDVILSKIKRYGGARVRATIHSMSTGILSGAEQAYQEETAIYEGLLQQIERDLLDLKIDHDD